MIIVLATCAPGAHAGDLSLLLNGKAIHFDGPPGTKFNEANWGMGLQYDFDHTGSKWVPYVTGSGFLDSFSKPSYYAGGGYLRRWQLGRSWHADAGGIAFLMTRQDFNGGRPFLGVLPAISFGTDRFSLNATYIPKVHPKMVALVFFQVKMKLTP